MIKNEKDNTKFSLHLDQAQMQQQKNKQRKQKGEKRAIVL